jgi:hypothetical protein
MSALFFLYPPDQLGHTKDEVFQVGIATYLGQPCPLMAPVIGCYFGKHGKQLDWYGANLPAASLPGHGHRSLHNKLQSIMQAMMKLGGLHSAAEVVNFLVDKIGHPYNTSCAWAGGTFFRLNSGVSFLVVAENRFWYYL